MRQVIKPGIGGATTLTGLTDVTVTDPVDGHVLTYDPAAEAATAIDRDGRLIVDEAAARRL